MGYKYLEMVEPAKNVARLALRREEKKNALCMALRDELEDAFGALAKNADVHAVVLAGGDGIFSAGYDLKEGQETGGKAFLHRFRQFFLSCYLFPKPMVAAVDGPALAGGFDLALAADFIVASTRARFGHPEIAFGAVAVTPLARFVTPAQLRQLCLLGEPLDVETAQSYGIVHTIVEPDRTISAATELAEKLAALPPNAIASTKAVLNHQLRTEVSISSDDAALERLLSGEAGTYDDYVAKKLG
jgi:enoyl-CoA hydratase